MAPQQAVATEKAASEPAATEQPGPARRPPPDLRRALTAALPLLMLATIAFIPFPVCPSRLTLGIPCPGCGLTRATVALLSFDFVALLRFHPLAPIITPLVAWEFGKPVFKALGLVTDAQLARLPRAPKATWTVLLVILLTLWGARLAGFLGGHPDPLDLTEGWVYQGGDFIYSLVTGTHPLVSGGS